MNNCEHIIAYGYLNLFTEQDNEAVLLKEYKNEDLIVTIFKYCPICGKKL